MAYNRVEKAAHDTFKIQRLIEDGFVHKDSSERLFKTAKAVRDLAFGHSDEVDPTFTYAVAVVYQKLVQEHQCKAQAEAAEKKAAEDTALGLTDFGITVSGPISAGKTTVLLLILQGLANAGLLSDSNTLDAFVNPRALLGAVRTQNTDSEETIVLKVGADDLKDAQDSLYARGNPTAYTAQAVAIEPVVKAQALTVDYTPEQLATYGWREAIASAAMQLVGESAFDADTDEVVLTVRKKAA